MDLENYLNNNDTDIIEISSKIEKLEIQLSEYKKIEEQKKQLMEELYNSMEKHEIKTWKTTNGVTFTRVEAIPDEEYKEIVYNDMKFKEENLELVKQYEEIRNNYKEHITKIKKGRKGYIKLTLPKGA